MNKSRWGMPRENQGLHIEVSYACLSDVILRKVWDRCNDIVTYYCAVLREEDWSWYENYVPAAADLRPPITPDRWTSITEAQITTLLEYES